MQGVIVQNKNIYVKGGLEISRECCGCGCSSSCSCGCGSGCCSSYSSSSCCCCCCCCLFELFGLAACWGTDSFFVGILRFRDFSGFNFPLLVDLSPLLGKTKLTKRVYFSPAFLFKKTQKSHYKMQDRLWFYIYETQCKFGGDKKGRTVIRGFKPNLWTQLKNWEKHVSIWAITLPRFNMVHLKTAPLYRSFLFGNHNF